MINGPDFPICSLGSSALDIYLFVDLLLWLVRGSMFKGQRRRAEVNPIVCCFITQVIDTTRKLLLSIDDDAEEYSVTDPRDNNV